MRRIAETATNVLLVVTCLVCSAYVSLQLYDRTRTRQPASGYKAGESIAHLTAVKFEKVDRTLLLGLKSSCIYCSESMPLYRTVVKWRDATKTPLRIVAACLEPRHECEEYLRANRVVVDDLVELPSSETKISATPTLLLADSTGTVQRVWQGLLLRQKRTEVALALFPTLETTARDLILNELIGD
jgi:hypothetical protein